MLLVRILPSCRRKSTVIAFASNCSLVPGEIWFLVLVVLAHGQVVVLQDGLVLLILVVLQVRLRKEEVNHSLPQSGVLLHVFPLRIHFLLNN